MKKIIRVGGYARVSTEEQKKYGYSIEAQVDKIKKYCELKGYQLVDIYIDEGFTASNMKRPRLIDLLNNLDKIDAIVFTRLDRFSRNVLEANKMLATLQKNNVSMIAIEEEDINTTDADGLFMFNLKVSLAEREIKKTSERIRSVFEYKIKEGQVISGVTALGYKVATVDGIKRMVKNEEEAPIVMDIFNYFLKYQSIRIVTERINEKYNIRKSYQVYNHLLKNEIYLGRYRDNYSFCEPYIDRDTFDKVQDIISKNIRSGDKRFTYIFSGLICCPECKKLLTGSKQLYRGRYYYYYRCNRHYISRLCPEKKSYSENLIEKYLLENVNTLVADRIGYIKSIEPENNVDADKKIKSLKTELDNLNYIFMKKRITIEEYDRLYEKTELKIKELEKVPTQDVDISHLTAFLTSGWKSAYGIMNREKKRTLWRNLIKEIHVDNDYNIKIIFY